MHAYRYFLNRNKNGDGFRELLNGRIFVDKTGIIDEINHRISTKEKWICISRPRRFGKTTVLETLAAYYTKGISTEDLFKHLNASDIKTFYKHLNAHNVISVNFNDYFCKNQTANDGIALFSSRLIEDLHNTFPDVPCESNDLPLYLDMICQINGEKFIFLIDEWDAIFRIKREEKEEQEYFLEFLRRLFKDKDYIELVYMTGILPVKKYNTGSALNMFQEFTMLTPKKFAPYFGFTEKEISRLCTELNSPSFDELKEWYNGYIMEGYEPVYNPRSVVEAFSEGKCEDYWNKTGGYSELEEYITQNFDGLREAIIQMLAGNEVEVNVLGFSNDLNSFQDKDEILTALIHLGYLTCKNGKARIPNREIAEEFTNSVKRLSWGTVTRLLKQSRKLLEATWKKDTDTVAALLEEVHDDMQEFKEYNNEHTLKCVIHLAYYAAQDDYSLQFEEPAGKGIADCLMIPRRKGIPGIIVELKYDQSPEDAIEQIKQKQYVKKLEHTAEKVLLTGINYCKKTKKHQCRIEELMLHQ